ncbi:hypothetical protein DFJ77DRAFT_436831 [Powellomyces hirtus]|nr:hypothetical protein DFJ77DRAFT_436831 [Powellomyces hirtus]
MFVPKRVGWYIARGEWGEPENVQEKKGRKASSAAFSAPTHFPHSSMFPHQATFTSSSCTVYRLIVLFRVGGEVPVNVSSSSAVVTGYAIDPRRPRCGNECGAPPADEEKEEEDVGDVAVVVLALVVLEEVVEMVIGLTEADMLCDKFDIQQSNAALGHRSGAGLDLSQRPFIVWVGPSSMTPLTLPPPHPATVWGRAGEGGHMPVQFHRCFRVRRLGARDQKEGVQPPPFGFLEGTIQKRQYDGKGGGQ